MISRKIYDIYKVFTVYDTNRSIRMAKQEGLNKSYVLASKFSSNA
jgi:hypothetical protein